MNTRAPCGAESIRNEPINDSFFAPVGADGAGSRCSTETRITGSAAVGDSDAAGETGAGAVETGAGAGTNCSARGGSDVVNHQTRITHTSAPKAEPDANVHSPRRSFEVEAARAGSTSARVPRYASRRPPEGRRLTRLFGPGERVAGPIDAGRSEQNSSSGSGAHRPLRSWLTAGFFGSIGWSGTELS